ncbi:MAG: LysM peptidoglycan-binding domain-containing protein [Lachnospiraceae bacterium]|nr:LysM peptidoglycan-binding domain-containing protein [Lachnospiraceae bacterium]
MKKIVGKGEALLLAFLRLVWGAGYLLISLAIIMYMDEGYPLRREVVPLILCFLLLILCQILLGVAFFLGRSQGDEKKGHLENLQRLVPAGTIPNFLSVVFLALFLNLPGSLEENEVLIMLRLLYFLGMLGGTCVYQLSLLARKPRQRCLYSLGLLAWMLFFLGGGTFLAGNLGELNALRLILLLQLAAICARPVWGWIIRRRPEQEENLGWRQRLKRTGVLLLGGGAAWLLIFSMPGELLEVEPLQDQEGYYMLCSREGFVWFVDQVRGGRISINARLTGDIILNDTDNWENWQEEPPKHRYGCMLDYEGCFDGNGFALEGYYSGQQAPIFLSLGQAAKVINLNIRKSWFQTTYEEASYLDDDGELQVLSAASLFYRNKGKVADCQVEAGVVGAWDAGGIGVINYGEMENCTFLGCLEAGMDFREELGEERWALETLYTGGICKSNRGVIRNCIQAGSVNLDTISLEAYMNYAAGGIVGAVEEEGRVEGCQNQGQVTCAQLAGGIAGANRGVIVNCENSGAVQVEQADMSYSNSLITAGICASNGGLVSACLNKGPVTIEQKWLSFYAPVYGIACNIVNPSRGITENCYYLSDSAQQDYRQLGVYKLTQEELSDAEAYVSGEKAMEDRDSFEAFSELPVIPGTDEEDYIHLRMGPEEDLTYEVQEGDSLWSIAESFYGDGNAYSFLGRDTDWLYPGERLTVPRQDRYLLHANEEEGFDWSFCVLPSGEKCPTRFYLAKPVDWYYGSMDLEAARGLHVLWPKDKNLGQDVPASDIRIFYRFEGNSQGDFFGEDWETVKEEIRESGEKICGQALSGLRFYRYILDGGESIYGYSFRLYRDTDTLHFVVFYRLQKEFLLECIGVEPVGEDFHLMERVRYLAARAISGPAVEKEECDVESFFGREDWNYPTLHNPFALGMAYDPSARCSSYMLFTGVQ